MSRPSEIQPNSRESHHSPHKISLRVTWTRRAIVCVAIFSPVFIFESASAGTCPTEGQLCSAACDDGDPCNGVETCTPPDIIRFCRCGDPPCDDGDPCTRDVCNASPRGVTCDHFPGGCDDGVYCNGAEVCFLGACATIPRLCKAPLLCDEDHDRCAECLTVADCASPEGCETIACNESTGLCESEPCIDDLFCNGEELCFSNGTCGLGPSPCNRPELCQEGPLLCNECSENSHCADDDPCTVERCDDLHSCRVEPCQLWFDSPPEGSVHVIGSTVDVVGRGPRGLDLVLVLDESGSIDGNDFEIMKDFAVSVVQSFYISPTTTRVGVSMFSTGARRILNLESNNSTIINTIDEITQWGGGTCIGCGINDGSANLQINGRVGAVQVMIVVTDGLNNLPNSSANNHLAAAILTSRALGHVRLAIGVGDSISRSQIDAIASIIPGFQTAFFLQYFASLSQIRDAIVLAASSQGASGAIGTLPGGEEIGLVVDATGQFTIPDWTILPGENTFLARMNLPGAPHSVSLTLLGTFLCGAICGDLSTDLKVDLQDVAAFMNCYSGRSWDSPTCGCGDLNGDTKIDGIDFAAFVGAMQKPTSDVPPNCVRP